MQGITPAQTAQAAKLLGLSGKEAEDAQQQMANLYKMFIKLDLTQVEINPFVVTLDGKGESHSPPFLFFFRVIFD